VELNAVYVIVARELKKFVREKSRLLSAIARPLLWLFIVGAGIISGIFPAKKAADSNVIESLRYE